MITGSALRRLEAITGLVATKSTKYCYKLEVSEHVAFFSFKRDEKDACHELREMNLRRVNNLVFEKQDWKCVTCGFMKPLQGHHKTYRSRWRRSMGALDCVENIDGLCADCHGSEHE